MMRPAHVIYLSCTNHFYVILAVQFTLLLISLLLFFRPGTCPLNQVDNC